MQEYNLEGYSNEAMNIDEGKGRGMILFIHKSLPFQVHQFDVDFNEAQFCTLKFKRKNTILIGSFYRSPSSATENNDNLNKLLDKINETFFSMFCYLETSTFNYPRINWETKSTTATSTDKKLKFLEKL